MSFEEEAESSESPNQSVIKLNGIYFWLTCLVPTVPLLAVYLYELMATREFLFVPLVFLVVAFLHWRNANGAFRLPVSMTRWIVVFVGLLIAFTSAFLANPWLSAFGFVMLACGAFSCVPGTIRPSLLPVSAPLICILKPPFRLDEIVMAWINRMTAWWSSIFLDFFELPHEFKGSVIRLVDSEVLVHEVTGGFLSIYFVIFLSLALMAANNMSLWLTPFYVAAAMVTTVLLDVLRVVVHAFSLTSMQMDLSTSGYATALNLVAIIISIGLLYSFHVLFFVAFHFVEPNLDAGTNPFVQLWNRFSAMSEGRAIEQMSTRNFRTSESRHRNLSTAGSVALIAVVLCLLTFSCIRSYAAPTLDDNVTSADKTMVIAPEDYFANVKTPTGSFDYVAMDLNKKEGSSKPNEVWRSADNGIQISVQVFQPLRGWRELTRTFQTSGWEVLDRDIATAENFNGRKVRSTTAASTAFASARLRIREPSVLEGYLYFSAISSSGTVMEAPTAWGSFADRLYQRIKTSDVAERDLMLMIQLFASSERKLDASEIRELQLTFTTLRDTISKKIADRGSEGLANNPEPLPSQ